MHFVKMLILMHHSTSKSTMYTATLLPYFATDRSYTLYCSVYLFYANVSLLLRNA